MAHSILSANCPIQLTSLTPAMVSTSEEDPVIAVVRYTSELAWADAGAEVAEQQATRECLEAQECIVTLRWLDLASLMLTSAAIVLPRISKNDMLSVYSVICNLVTRSNNPDEELEMAKLISEKATQQPNGKPTFPLRVIIILYNLLKNPCSKLFVYTKALDLADNGKLSENIIPTFRKIDTLLQGWKIRKVDQRALLPAISYILKDNKSTIKDSLAYLTKYLATFPVDSEEAEAIGAIIKYVKSPSVICQCDLLDMPAVKQLEKDEHHSSVYKLLKILFIKRLGYYLGFDMFKPTLFSDYGLIHEDCITKMRLMTLYDFSSSLTVEFPYTRIMEAYQSTKGEVNQWIVEAVIAKILDNRLNETVIVSRHVEKAFGQHGDKPSSQNMESELL